MGVVAAGAQAQPVSDVPLEHEFRRPDDLRAERRVVGDFPLFASVIELVEVRRAVGLAVEQLDRRVVFSAIDEPETWPPRAALQAPPVVARTEHGGQARRHRDLVLHVGGDLLRRSSIVHVHRRRIAIQLVLAQVGALIDTSGQRVPAEVLACRELGSQRVGDGAVERDDVAGVVAVVAVVIDVATGLNRCAAHLTRIRRAGPPAGIAREEAGVAEGGLPRGRGDAFFPLCERGVELQAAHARGAEQLAALVSIQVVDRAAARLAGKFGEEQRVGTVAVVACRRHEHVAAPIVGPAVRRVGVPGVEAAHVEAGLPRAGGVAMFGDHVDHGQEGAGAV